MGYISFEVEGLEDLRMVRLALTQANRDIPRDSSRELMAEARLLRDKARSAILAMPTPAQAGHTGLRKEVAAGVHVQRLPIAGDVSRVRIGTDMKERDEKRLPRGLDTTWKGWRHPFFGDRSRWYRQHGEYSWFMDTMEDGEDNLERRLYEVLRENRDDIAQGGRIG